MYQKWCQYLLHHRRHHPAHGNLGNATVEDLNYVIPFEWIQSKNVTCESLLALHYLYVSQKSKNWVAFIKMPKCLRTVTVCWELTLCKAMFGACCLLPLISLSGQSCEVGLLATWFCRRENGGLQIVSNLAKITQQKWRGRDWKSGSSTPESHQYTVTTKPTNQPTVMQITRKCVHL